MKWQENTCSANALAQTKKLNWKMLERNDEMKNNDHRRRAPCDAMDAPDRQLNIKWKHIKERAFEWANRWHNAPTSVWLCVTDTNQRHLYADTCIGRLPHISIVKPFCAIEIFYYIVIVLLLPSRARHGRTIVKIIRKKKKMRARLIVCLSLCGTPSDARLFCVDSSLIWTVLREMCSNWKRWHVLFWIADVFSLQLIIYNDRVVGISAKLNYVIATDSFNVLFSRISRNSMQFVLSIVANDWTIEQSLNLTPSRQFTGTNRMK